MYYNIYEVDTSPIQNSMMDAVTVGDHSVFISKCAVVDELEDKERTITLQTFGKWLKKEELGTLKKTVFTLNADVSCGKHFADRYAGFHQLAETLTAVTEEDYLHRFHNIRNLTSDLMKAIESVDNGRISAPSNRRKIVLYRQHMQISPLRKDEQNDKVSTKD